MARTFIASLCAALAVVVALFFIPWPSAKREAAGKSSSDRDGTTAAAPPSKPGRAPAGKPHREQRTHQPEPADTGFVTGFHSPEALKDFMLPKVQLTGVTMETAVLQLLDQYREICAQTGQAPLEFNVTIEGATAEVASFSFDSDSLLANLRAVAASFNMTLERSGIDLVFRPVGELPHSNQKPISSSKIVPASFLNELRFLTQVGQGDAQSDLLSQLQSLGVVRSTSPEASVQYDPASGTLETNIPPDDFARLEALVAEIATPPKQIKYTTKVVKSSHPLDFIEGQVLSPDAFQAALRLASRQQLSAQSLPTMVLRPGQDAELNVPGNDGVSIQTRGNLYGLATQTSPTVRSPDAGDGPDTPAAASPGIVPPGHWLVHARQSPKGGYDYYFFQPSPVTPGQ